jgi:dipeptidyl aminopeptidase/acylaminoacyl peptidase
MSSILRRRMAAGALGLLIIFLGASRPYAADKRPITEKDLFKFTWIADPQISPDGSRVAFVNVVVNEKENRYETSIATVSSTDRSAPKSLTAGIRDTSPRWSPDGKWLAFLRAVEKDGQPQPAQIYLLRTDGGEARALTDLPKGASGPLWAPDGKSIAFSSTALQDDLKKPDPAAKGEHKSDVKVVSRAIYRSNGNPTYVDQERHAHIWIVPVSDTSERQAPRQVTAGEFDERGYQWSPDGSTIYFTSDRRPESYYEPADSDLYSVPAAGGSITKVASIEGTIGTLAVAPDGNRIAFVGTLHGEPVRSYSQADLWVVDAAPGSTPRNLTASYDFDINGGIGGDQASPRGEQPKPIVWSKDSSSLIVVAAERGSSNLRRVSVSSGTVSPLTEGAQDIVAYTATPDGSKLAVTISTQTRIGDISIVPATGGVATRTQITDVNDALFSDIRQSEPEEIWYTSFDGQKIQGWILKPPDFDSSRKYPMILEIHGGPHSAYGNTYTHEFMWMAAKGYVVLFTNPRGSTSYGQTFGNLIQFKYPGDDYKDLMAGVDEVVRRGYVDPNRLGVTGGSGGGLLTDWTITQTQRFKAAVAQRDIADWYGFWFTADFTLFQPTWFHKAPWEDPQDFAARSPITHVANVTTPLMLVLGDQDYRTPPADGGEMMFRALKYRKIPTVMVRFPRENHELSRSGEPWHRVERLEHIVGWMDKWLQGRNVGTYE